MRFVSLSIILVLAASASAQQITNESLTAKPWSHTATGTWKNAIADGRSLYGKVDHLISAKSFVYARAPLTLSPGTYVAVARFAKVNAASGSAPIDLRVLPSKAGTLRTAVSVQTVDKFIHTQALVFTIAAKLPMIFFIENKDTKITKTEYLFDSFHVGRVEHGHAVHVESLGRRWGHAWGGPHYCKEIPDKTATFGFVEHLNPRFSSNCGTGSSNLWWFRWNSRPRSFLPGIHTGSMRIKKITSAAGSHNFKWFAQVSTNNGTNWTSLPAVTWDKSTHVVGKWVYSPNISINVKNPTHLYRWRLDAYNANIPGNGHSYKADYYFDSFEVRRGQYTPFGSSCMNGALAKMDGNIPQLGHTFEMRVGPLNSKNPVMLILGVKNPNLDLSVNGWTGCRLYASLDVLVDMPIANGQAKIVTTVPLSVSLVNLQWYTSAYQPTATGIATTNGVLGTIGN